MSLTPIDNALSDLRYAEQILHTLENNPPFAGKFIVTWNQRRKVARLRRQYHKLLDV